MNESIMGWNSINYCVPHGFMMRSKQILFDIGFALKQGTISALIGPNGAGKSTTLKIGAGFIQPYSGNVTVFDDKAVTRAARKSIGFLPEIQNPYKYLTIKEWLFFLGKLSGLSKEQLSEKFDVLSAEFGFFEIENRLMGTLSKGQHQRIGFAQALLHDPAILLLDEPMSGLDPIWREKIKETMLKFVENQGTILFSSHVMSDVDCLADQVIMIENGQNSWSGEMSALNSKIREYEIVYSLISGEIKTIDRLTKKNIAKYDNRWICSVNAKNKEHMIAMAFQKFIAIESIKPIYIYYEVISEKP